MRATLIRRGLGTATVVLALAAIFATPLVAKKKTKPTVSTEFYGYADFELYSTYAWRDSVSRDPGLERRMRDNVDAIMKKKGWLIVADKPDIWLLAESKSFGASLGMGAIQLTVIDAPSGQVAWRGLAANMAPETRDGLAKLIDDVAKALLKDFPKSGSR